MNELSHDRGLKECLAQMSTPQVLTRAVTPVSYFQPNALSSPTILPPWLLARSRKLGEWEPRWLRFDGYKERRITLEARKEGPDLVPMTRVQDNQGAIQEASAPRRWHWKRGGGIWLTSSSYFKNCQRIALPDHNKR